jgi:hypothetical protein
MKGTHWIFTLALSSAVFGLDVNPDSLALSVKLMMKYYFALDTITIINSENRTVLIDTVAIKFLNGSPADFRAGWDCDPTKYYEYNYRGWLYGIGGKSLRYGMDSLFFLQDSTGTITSYSLLPNDSMIFVLRVIANCPICDRTPSFPSTTKFQFVFIENTGDRSYFILRLNDPTGVAPVTNPKARKYGTVRTPDVNLRGQSTNSPGPACIVARKGNTHLKVILDKTGATR